MAEGTDLEKARAAKKKALTMLAGVAEVNGVGIARVGQGYGVKINLAEPLPSSVRLPEELDGVPLVVERVGPILKRVP